MSPHGPQNPGARRARNRILTLATLLAVPFSQAEATTLATFEWVDAFGSTGSGMMAISLHDPAPTGNEFVVGQAKFSDITQFHYTFSSGLTVNLLDLTSHAFNPAQAAWTTTTVKANTTGGSAIGDTDLTTGFTFSGANNLKIANSQGTLFNIQVANNLINPGSGGVANDFGYWKLDSLTPVPLPAALPLLLAGLGALGVARRRSSTANQGKVS